MPRSVVSARAVPLLVALLASPDIGVHSPDIGVQSPDIGVQAAAVRAPVNLAADAEDKFIIAAGGIAPLVALLSSPAVGVQIQIHNILVTQVKPATSC